MEPKKYSSYDEIDKDLEILKLEKEIAFKKACLSVENTLDSFSSKNILQNIFGNVGTVFNKYGLFQKIVVPYLINRFLK